MSVSKNDASLTRSRGLAQVAIPLSLLAIFCLWLAGDHAAYESRVLRVGVGFVFSLLAGGGSAVLFGRAFLAGGKRLRLRVGRGMATGRSDPMRCDGNWRN